MLWALKASINDRHGGQEQEKDSKREERNDPNPVLPTWTEPRGTRGLRVPLCCRKRVVPDRTFRRHSVRLLLSVHYFPPVLGNVGLGGGQLLNGREDSLGVVLRRRKLGGQLRRDHPACSHIGVADRMGVSLEVQELALIRHHERPPQPRSVPMGPL